MHGAFLHHLAPNASVMFLAAFAQIHALDAGGDVHAAADHRLLGFRTAGGEEDLELEPVFPEYAGVLAELRNALLPAAALPDGDLELILRGRDGLQKEKRNGRGQGLARQGLAQHN